MDWKDELKEIFEEYSKSISEDTGIDDYQVLQNNVYMLIKSLLKEQREICARTFKRNYIGVNEEDYADLIREAAEPTGVK